MYKVILTVLSCCILASSLSACLDAKEIDSWAYVYSIGIDKGVSDRLRITVQIPTMKGSSGGGSKNEGSKSSLNSDFTVISLDCPSFYSGVDMINTSLSRRINYMHTKFFVVSEDLAKEDISRLIFALVRDRQIRRTMHMIVVRVNASDFIKEFNPVIGTAISKTQEGMMNMQDETGFFDDIDFGDFIDDIKSSKRQPVATLASLNNYKNYKKEGSTPKSFKNAGDYYAGELPRSDGNKTEYLGTALFNGGKMIGELNGDETRVLLMATGEFKKGSLPIPDPQNHRFTDTIIIRQKKKPDIKIEFKNKKPIIHLKIFLSGELQALQSDVDYENLKKKPTIEYNIKSNIKKELDKTINKCKKMNCDVFGFGDKACMQFPTIQEWESYNWLSHFKEAKVTTDVEFTILRTGALIKTNYAKTNKGGKK